MNIAQSVSEYFANRENDFNNIHKLIKKNIYKKGLCLLILYFAFIRDHHSILRLMSFITVSMPPHLAILHRFCFTCRCPTFLHPFRHRLFFVSIRCCCRWLLQTVHCHGHLGAKVQQRIAEGAKKRWIPTVKALTCLLRTFCQIGSSTVPEWISMLH